MRSEPRQIQGSSGFTIIELAVTCFIILILGTITIAGFSSWLPSYRLKSAARDLYSNMQQAKMAAIKQEGNCTITYSTVPSHRYVVTGVTKTVVLADYGSGVRFQGDSGQTYSPAIITFNSRGMCSGNGWAYLSNEKQSAYYRVGPNASGIIKMEQYTDSWPTP